MDINKINELNVVEGNREETNKIIEEFLLFLNNLDVEGLDIENFTELVQNDNFSRTFISVLYFLLNLNFDLSETKLVLDDSDESEYIEEIKGGNSKKFLLFLMILIIFSNIFTQVNSLFLTRHVLSKTQSIETTEFESLIITNKSPNKFIKLSDEILELKTGLDMLASKSKEYKINTLIKLIDSVFKTAFVELNFLNIKNSILSNSELLVATSQLDKTTKDRLTLMSKSIDSIINLAFVFKDTLKILNSGGVISVSYIFSIVKVGTSFGQILQSLYLKENQKLKRFLNLASNVLFYRDIGKMIKKLSLLYIGYLGLIIYSQLYKYNFKLKGGTKLKGSKTCKKRKFIKKKKKTKNRFIKKRHSK
jgi:hypothetical protein